MLCTIRPSPFSFKTLHRLEFFDAGLKGFLVIMNNLSQSLRIVLVTSKYFCEVDAIQIFGLSLR